MKYPLATETWNEKEIQAAKDVLDSGKCTMGEITKKFELEFAKKFKSSYAVFCNSGSSANLLAVGALMYAKNGLNPGDEVIVPAVSWSTTYYPLHQYGLKMKFIDVSLEDFNLNIDKVIQHVTPKTKAIMAVNLLGMPCSMSKLKPFCEQNNIILIEDNCESMGATYEGKQCGTFGRIGTFSTYFSHHICTVEGGVVVTDDEELYHILLSLRSHGWTRHLPEKNHVEDKTGNPFRDSFRFVLPGYNLRGNDIFSAIGLEQINKLDDIITKRQLNATYLQGKLDDNSCLRVGNGFIKLQRTGIDISNENKSNSSWFGFGFICHNISRDSIVDLLMKNDIECRPIVAGNFCNNPVINHMNCEITDDLPNANYIDKNGFFIGNNGEDLTNQIDHFISTLSKFK